jgi:hypothetical protein
MSLGQLSLDSKIKISSKGTIVSTFSEPYPDIAKIFHKDRLHLSDNIVFLYYHLKVIGLFTRVQWIFDNESEGPRIDTLKPQRFSLVLCCGQSTVLFDLFTCNKQDTK